MIAKWFVIYHPGSDYAETASNDPTGKLRPDPISFIRFRHNYGLLVRM